MSVQVTIDLPEDVFSVLRTSPELFVQELRLAAAVTWYGAGMVSQSKAAELAGKSRHDFLQDLSRFKISPFQETTEDLAEI